VTGRPRQHCIFSIPPQHREHYRQLITRSPQLEQNTAGTNEDTITTGQQDAGISTVYQLYCTLDMDTTSNNSLTHSKSWVTSFRNCLFVHLYIHRHNIHHVTTSASATKLGATSNDHDATTRGLDQATTSSTVWHKHIQTPQSQNSNHDIYHITMTFAQTTITSPGLEVNIKDKVTWGSTVIHHPSEQNWDTGTRPSNQEYPLHRLQFPSSAQGTPWSQRCSEVSAIRSTLTWRNSHNEDLSQIGSPRQF